MSLFLFSLVGCLVDVFFVTQTQFINCVFLFLWFDFWNENKLSTIFYKSFDIHYIYIKPYVYFGFLFVRIHKSQHNGNYMYPRIYIEFSLILIHQTILFCCVNIHRTKKYANSVYKWNFPITFRLLPTQYIKSTEYSLQNFLIIYLKMESKIRTSENRCWSEKLIRFQLKLVMRFFSSFVRSFHFIFIKAQAIG